MTESPDAGPTLHHPDAEHAEPHAETEAPAPAPDADTEAEAAAPAPQPDIVVMVLEHDDAVKALAERVAALEARFYRD